MAPSATLTLPFKPPRATKQKSLQSQVQQIVKQKGPFRQITEQSLESDVHKDNEDTTKMDLDEDSEDDSEPTIEARLQSLQQTRQTFLDALAHANNEILCMLDMVSLSLWSNTKIPGSDNDNQINTARAELAHSTMSPALSADAPQGSLEMRLVQETKPEQSVVQKLDHSSRGWRIQRYGASSKALSDAAERLSKEARKQSQYWQQLAEIRDAGWPVSRLPNDNHTMIVHLGCAESAPMFRSRGIRALRQNKDGRITVGYPPPNQGIKSLKLRIFRNGVETGSTAKSSQITLGDIRQELKAARDALFEDELFYEASREARLIANMGVNSSTEVIKVKVTDTLTFSIEHTGASSSSQESLGPDNDLASILLISLKSLLTAAHQSAYKRRATQSPPPLTLAPPTVPELPLLRPLIAQLQHNVNRSSLQDLLDTYKGTLKKAKLGFSYRDVSESSRDQTSASFKDLRGLNSNSLEVTMPTTSKLVVSLNTYLGSPQYGSKFQVTTPLVDSRPINTVQPCPFTEFKAYFEQLLARDIAVHAQEEDKSAGNWTLADLSGRKLVLKESGQARASLEISIRANKLLVKFAKRSSKHTSDQEWSAQQTHTTGLDEQISQWTKDLD